MIDKKWIQATAPSGGQGGEIAKRTDIGSIGDAPI
jgi:hypothetical protein